MHAMMQSLWMGVSNNRWTMLLSRWFDLLGENKQRSVFPPWLKNFSNLPIFKITHCRQHRKLHGVEISNNLLQSDLTGLCCWFYLNWCTNPPMHWITTSSPSTDLRFSTIGFKVTRLVCRWFYHSHLATVHPNLNLWRWEIKHQLTKILPSRHTTELS